MRDILVGLPVIESVHLSEINILMVEDSPSDAELSLEAFKDSALTNKLWITENGKKALEFLNREGDYADVATPDLILLDLNMPVMNGHEFLKVVKNDEKHRRIPVIILTTSDSEDDVRTAYHNYASSYVTKPGDFSAFIEVVRAVEGFYLRTAKKVPTS